MGFLDGSKPCPKKFLYNKKNKVTTTTDPAFIEWNVQDQNFLSWIRATIFEHVLSQIAGMRTSCAAWIAIEHSFASLSRAHTIMDENNSRGRRQPKNRYVTAVDL